MKVIFCNFYKAGSKSIFIKQEYEKSNDPGELSLIGARIGVFSETEEGDELNISTLKAVTGNDLRSIRPLYCNDKIEFKLIIKPILLTNYKPELNTTDTALLDRLSCIPFDARFVSEPKDENEYLKDKYLKDNEKK